MPDGSGLGRARGDNELLQEGVDSGLGHLRSGDDAEHPANGHDIAHGDQLAAQHPRLLGVDAARRLGALDIDNLIAYSHRRVCRNMPADHRPLLHRHAPFRHGDCGDLLGARRGIHGDAHRPAISRTAAMILAGLGRYMSSSSGAKGIGVCGGVTLRMGAFSAVKAFSAAMEAISAAMPQRG